MKRILNKIKTILATLWTIIISFTSKVMGQLTTSNFIVEEPLHFQTKYWVAPLPEAESNPITFIRIVQIWLIILIFIVWFVNLLRIRKIDDKTLKKKKIRNTIIIISILILLLIAALIIPAWLLTR